jgi:hypothetical protein
MMIWLEHEQAQILTLFPFHKTVGKIIIDSDGEIEAVYMMVTLQNR